MKLVLALAVAVSAQVTCDDAPIGCGRPHDGGWCVAKKGNRFRCKDWKQSKCEKRSAHPAWDAVWCPDDLCSSPTGLACDGCMVRKNAHNIKCNTKSKFNTVAKCVAAAGKPQFQEAAWCGNPPPSLNEDKSQCLRGVGFWDGLTSDFCGTCCIHCTAVDGVSEFTSQFEQHTWGWEPKDKTKCVCLEMDESGYESGNLGEIYLTPHKDCVRMVGSNNHIIGGEGDDVMYVNGVGNHLDGTLGVNHLTMEGSGGIMHGGGGSGQDVCVDLGSNSFLVSSCESCFRGGVQVDCLPTPTTTAEKTECLAARTQWQSVTANFCSTCCPACVSYDKTNFQGTFALAPTGSAVTLPNSACACLDLEGVSYYNSANAGNSGMLVAHETIQLTDQSDCVRITGGGATRYNRIELFGGADAVFLAGTVNAISGGAGDDVMESDGDMNVNMGGAGNDKITLYGADGILEGGAGGIDICINHGTNWFRGFTPAGQSPVGHGCEFCTGGVGFGCP